MGFFVSPGQFLQPEMSVALGRAETRMSQQFLDGPQVHAAVEQVGGEAVAQRVGAHPRPHGRRFEGSAQQGPHTGGRETAAPLVQEDRGAGRQRLGRQEGRTEGEIGIEDPGRLGVVGHHAFLPPLAQDAQGALIRDEILKIQPHQLGDAQPRRVEQLQQAGKPCGGEIHGGREVKQRLAFPFREEGWQALRLFGVSQTRGGIHGEPPRLPHPFEKPPDGGENPRLAGGVQTPVPQFQGEPPQGARTDLPGIPPGAHGMIEEFPKIAHLGPHRVGGHAARTLFEVEGLDPLPQWLRALPCYHAVISS